MGSFAHSSKYIEELTVYLARKAESGDFSGGDFFLFIFLGEDTINVLKCYSSTQTLLLGGA